MENEKSIEKLETATKSNKKIYRKYYIRNSDPGFPRCFVVFPYFSLVSPGNFKKFPDPERNLHISYHTAELN